MPLISAAYVWNGPPKTAYLLKWQQGYFVNPLVLSGLFLWLPTVAQAVSSIENIFVSLIFYQLNLFSDKTLGLLTRVSPDTEQRIPLATSMLERGGGVYITDLVFYFYKYLSYLMSSTK
jgi:hypothetical protein